MKSELTVASFFLIGAVALIIMSLFYASPAPKSKLIQSLVVERSAANDIGPIDAQILNGKFIQEVKNYKVFGDRPVTLPADQISRPDPFAGL
jgi:hypothetical protein